MRAKKPTPKKTPKMKRRVQYELYEYGFDFTSSRRGSRFAWMYYDGPYSKAQARKELKDVSQVDDKGIVIVKVTIEPIYPKTRKRRVVKKRSVKKKARLR